MFIAGNWKMNMEKQGALNLIDDVLKGVEGVSLADVIVCPPSVYLESAIRRAADTRVHIGAQNVFYREYGAFTGGASLKAETFCKIVRIAESTCQAKSS